MLRVRCEIQPGEGAAAAGTRGQAEFGLVPNGG